MGPTIWAGISSLRRSFYRSGCLVLELDHLHICLGHRPSCCISGTSGQHRLCVIVQHLAWPHIGFLVERDMLFYKILHPESLVMRCRDWVFQPQVGELLPLRIPARKELLLLVFLLRFDGPTRMGINLNANIFCFLYHFKENGFQCFVCCFSLSVCLRVI